MQTRRTRLVDPRLQSKFILAFACVAGCCVLLQAVSAVLSLHALADRLPFDGPIVLSELGRTTFAGLVVSFLLLVPLSVAVATILTHRVAGPLYRMRLFLEAVERGERPEDCRIRTGDELQDFCALINRATAPLRQPEADEGSPALTESPPAAAVRARRVSA